MGFEIRKVLDLKVDSIPVDKNIRIDIKALNDKVARQKLYNLLINSFDAQGKIKGVLENEELINLYSLLIRKRK